MLLSSARRVCSMMVSARWGSHTELGRRGAVAVAGQLAQDDSFVARLLVKRRVPVNSSQTDNGRRPTSTRIAAARLRRACSGPLPSPRGRS